MTATIYFYVYVTQVGMDADKNQLQKSLLEAEKYDGPSLIIAYAPCINHGLKEGMGRTQANTKQAVEAGYWHLYRFNPELKKEGKNSLISKLDILHLKQHSLKSQMNYLQVQKKLQKKDTKLTKLWLKDRL
mgnify:CR=1 FL=1